MSSFINEEYEEQVIQLQEKNLVRNQQQQALIEQLRITVSEVVQYIADQEKLTEEEFNRVRQGIQNVSKISNDRDNALAKAGNTVEMHFDGQIILLKQQINKLFLIALGSAFFAIGMGVAIWYLK